MIPRKVKDMSDDQLASTLLRSSERIKGAVRRANAALRELWTRGHLTSRQMELYRLCLGRRSEGDRALREANLLVLDNLGTRLLRPEYVPQQPPAWTPEQRERLYCVAPDLRRKP